MGDLFKGVHLLTQSEYNTLAANEQLDPDVLYATPENVTELVRLHTEQIAQNVENIDKNKSDIAVNTKDIVTLKNTSTAQSSDITDIKNNISEIIVRDTNQDNRLTNIEENFATKEYVTENGGKIDYIAVNGVDQTITDKRVNIVVPDVTNIENELATNVVTLDGTQTITGPKTFTEHIYLANSDGTIDRISHLNNNFIIHSGATNSVALNIDEGLEKIYAFNNELAFKSDITEAVGTTVYVDGTAVASLSFSADPQIQINLLATSIDNNKSDLLDAVDTKVSKAGDTMTGELIASAGVAFGNNKIRVENSGNTFEIVHIENDVDKNVFNYTHGAMFTLNNIETPVVIQGSDDRPSYVSGSGVMSDLALESDITTAIAGLGTVFDLKGVKDAADDLPTTGNSIGDVWYVTAEEVGYIWLNDGTEDRWERFGAPIDLSGYATTSALNTAISALQTELNTTNANVATNASNIANKANSDASNLTSSNIQSWQNKLNDLTNISNVGDADAYGVGQATVIETYLSRDKLTWYRVWSDGWKECGLRVSSDPSTQIVAALPITFGVEYKAFTQVIGDNYSNCIVLAKTGSTVTISFGVRTIGTWPGIAEIYCCGY